jgi:hypothetical protein
MYKLLSPDYFTKKQPEVVLRIADNTFIPMDEANTDYQAFLKYQAEGGKVYGADEEVPTPAEENT